MEKLKIHCVEMQKESFDRLQMEEVEKMIGWIEPGKDGTWEVNLADGNQFTCKNQETAQIIASLEESKALLMQK